MIDQETLHKLREMKLSGMAEALQELLGRAPSHEMTLAEQLGVLVEREWSDRDNRRLGRLLKAAKIGSDACLEDVRCAPGRGLDRAVVRDLATGRWGAEILEDRYDRSSTVITTQIPTKMWHDQLLQPTIADAICDRLVHNAHVLALDGSSLRGEKNPKWKKSKS